MKKENIKIQGMHCASCALNINKSLQKQTGIITSEVNYATEKAVIEYDETKINLEDIKKDIVSGGYKIAEENSKKPEKESKWPLLRLIIAGLFTLPLLAIMFGLEVPAWWQHNLSFVVVFILGFGFHKRAFQQLKKGQSNMDTLVSLGTLSAYFFSLYSLFNGQPLYFESAAVITTLILLGKYLENSSKNRASRAIAKLMELRADKARVINTEGQEEYKDIDNVKLDEIVLIKPGEKIPLDGEILNGQTTTDEAMLTGESIPAPKGEGDQVFGATINLDGVIKIKVIKTSQESVLAQIIATVEEAQKFKAPIQKLADKIASIFVPVVMTIALVTVIVIIFSTQSVSLAIIRAVTILVVACPCALGLATPIAIMVGTGVGAKKGILIKNGESFESAKNINTVIFDKTGTLTTGKIKVQNILSNPNKGFVPEKILKIAFSLANNSNHPLSEAVVKFAKGTKSGIVAIENFKELPGKGVGGMCQQHKVQLFLGNKKLMADNNIDLNWIEKAEQENRDSAILFVSHGNDVIGAITLQDKVRPEAKEAIQKIKALNLRTIMLSGDNKFVAEKVSKELGIDEYIAEIMPNEKQEKVLELQKQGNKVVFVGDGINDAPALAQSDLGIAMSSGTDIAKETGSIIIMNSNPLKVYEAIVLSRKTFNIIKQNLFWAFIYNIIAIPLAIAGIISPMIAAAAMSLSSVSVIGNSLRLYRNK